MTNIHSKWTWAWFNIANSGEENNNKQDIEGGETEAQPEGQEPNPQKI